MHKSKKETKGRRHDLVLTCSVCGHRAGGPNGGGGGGGFSFGWMGFGAKKKIGKLGFDFEMKRDNNNQFGV